VHHQPELKAHENDEEHDCGDERRRVFLVVAHFIHLLPRATFVFLREMAFPPSQIVAAA
jgi:hypothetical protein